MSDDAERNRVVIAQVGTMVNTLFASVASSALDSIQNGSELTGAPGQPVDTGALKGSWQVVFDSPDTAVIGTNLEYAESIEDGVSYAHGGTPLTLRSEVGGWHSVSLTAANLDRIVVAERARLTGSQP